MTDHKTVEALFKQFEGFGEKAKHQKKRIVSRIITELAVHAAIEEQVLYPAARKAVPDEEKHVLEALEEHHIVKWTLSELEKMGPDDERFDAKVAVLIESIRHHVEEEEGELFPKIQEALDKTELEALGASLEAAKKVAPTHPHPRAPDTPPGNVVAGLGAGLVDRVMDAGKMLARKVLSAPKKSANGAQRSAAPKKTAAAKKTAAKKTAAKKTEAPKKTAAAKKTGAAKKAGASKKAGTSTHAHA
jgi:hemerythrin superfamily protein